MSRSRHIPALDGLRGIAVLLVVSWHALRAPHAGALGVDLFFVLSGFLITSLLISEWRRSGSISLRAFYRRRALRLLPALFFLLGVYVLTVLLLTVSGQGSSYHLSHTVAGAGLAVAYVSNVMQAFHPIEPAGMGHLWSLAQEEQFYLLWPCTLLVLLKRRIKPERIMKALALVIAVVFTYRFGLMLDGAGFYRLWFGPDTHADPILIGCLAGVAYAYGFEGQARTAAVLRRLEPVAIAVALVVVIGFSSHTRELYLGPMTLFSLACGLVILSVVASPSSITSRALGNPGIRYVGRISYGIYLWHLPLVVAFGAWGAPASLVIAGLSYRYVETPFLQRRHRERRQTDRAAVRSPVAAEPAV
jgi:peptidoglycan/LPS O-acetylase OafA/YrhL